MQEELARILKVLFARLFSEWIEKHVPPEVQREIWSYTWPILLLVLAIWILQAIVKEMVGPKGRAATAAALAQVQRVVKPLRIDCHRGSRWPLVISGVGLFAAAVGTWPYDFYTLLRFGVLATCAIEIVGAGLATRHRFWTWVLVAIALLYNPFYPARLHRETWAGINWATLAVFVVLLALLKPASTNDSRSQSVVGTEEVVPMRGPDGRFVSRPRKNGS